MTDIQANNITLKEKYQVEPGQLWQLGQSRLICGDCTDPAIVAALMGTEKAVCMWTDPPYGVSYVGKTKDALRIQNDKEKDIPTLLQQSFTLANQYLENGSPVYVTYPQGRQQVHFIQAFLNTGWLFHESLIWVKDLMVLGHSDYHLKHEPILYGWKGKNRRWYAGRNQVSVFAVRRPRKNTLHPTMKPIELVEVHLKNSTQPGDIVYDPFCGSGTTLIACEIFKRRGRGIEISPDYVAATLERWHGMTGLQPERINYVG